MGLYTHTHTYTQSELCTVALAAYTNRSELAQKGDFTHDLPCSLTGSHLNLKTWCAGQLSRGPERQSHGARGCTTPGHKTASMKTSYVSPDSDLRTQKKRKPKHMRNRKAMMMKHRVRHDRFLDKNGTQQLQLGKR